MSDSGKGDAEKARYWQKTIREAVRSGVSIEGFCGQRRRKEGRFCRWQCWLEAGCEERRGGQGNAGSNQAGLTLARPAGGEEGVVGERAWLRLQSTKARGLYVCNASPPSGWGE